jgi:hypothetical protein
VYGDSFTHNAEVLASLEEPPRWALPVWQPSAWALVDLT